MHIASIGIDLGKTNFHLVALGERNKVLARKKFSRAQLLAYTTNLPPTLIGLEACLGGRDCRFNEMSDRHSGVVHGPTKLRGAEITVPDIRVSSDALVLQLDFELTVK